MTDSIPEDAVAAVFSGTEQRPAEHRRTFALMGGSATITLVGGTASLLDDLVALADQCESLWSRFLPTSDLSRVNAAEGRPTPVHPLTERVVRSMIEGWELTGGDFDPTLLVDLLAIGYDRSVVAPDFITRLPPSAGRSGNLGGVQISAGMIAVPVGTTLDPGGIGKGLAADVICERGLAAGAMGVLAEISGDVVVAGRSPRPTGWHLAVEDPFDPTRRVAQVRLTRGALVTSSQRKRRFDDRHHLIDPRTHTSADTRVQTVSVIAATGARAETLTKPGFLRDPADYLGWLPTVGAAGLIIDDTGAALASQNWSRYL